MTDFEDFRPGAVSDPTTDEWNALRDTLRAATEYWQNLQDDPTATFGKKVEAGLRVQQAQIALAGFKRFKVDK